jgi:hypothetical protein
MPTLIMREKMREIKELRWPAAIGRLYSLAPARRASRIVYTLLVLTAGWSAPAVTRAQDTARVSTDSLLARLRALEASVDVLQKQVAEAATSGVTTRTRIQVELSGRVVMNTFSNERIVNNVDNPQFVRRDTAARVPLKGMGMAVRQTMFGIRANVSDVLGGSFHGAMDVDFYGGQQPSSGGRTFPLLRIRTAHGTLAWSRAEILAGQEIPLFSPLNPISPAAVGTPGFVAAGNLWLWLPQVRATVHTGTAFDVGLQAAVLAPTSGDAVAAFDTDFDAAERTRRPYIESRVRAKWGEFEKEGELGCSVHLGWVSVAAPVGARPDSNLTSKAAGCDARLPILWWLEVRGEGYTGDLMRGLGGGAIGQGVGVNGDPVHDDAGWGQINLRPFHEILTGGAGCGIDRVRERNVLGDPNARLRNTTCSAYVQWKPGTVFLGFEGRRTATEYSTGRFANNHFNLAIGFEF